MDPSEPVIVINFGKVFEGNFRQFEENFFSLQGLQNQQEKIEAIADWAAAQGWDASFCWRH